MLSLPPDLKDYLDLEHLPKIVKDLVDETQKQAGDSSDSKLEPCPHMFRDLSIIFLGLCLLGLLLQR